MAYDYNNIILLPVTFEVIGVKLGDCVFGRQANMKGKYFNCTFCNQNGEILARDNGESRDEHFDAVKVMAEAWKLITGLKDHICPWIVPNDQWANIRLDKYLAD